MFFLIANYTNILSLNLLNKLDFFLKLAKIVLLFDFQYYFI